MLGGETGRHLLTGGADADNFVLLSRAESAASATTRDTIADFEGDLDVVDLRLIDARADAPANNAFTFIGTNVAWGGQAG